MKGRSQSAHRCSRRIPAIRGHQVESASHTLRNRIESAAGRSHRRWTSSGATRSWVALSCSSIPTCSAEWSNTANRSPTLAIHDLDQETAPAEVSGGVLEHRDLVVLGRDVADGVEDDGKTSPNRPSTRVDVMSPSSRRHTFVRRRARTAAGRPWPATARCRGRAMPRSLREARRGPCRRRAERGLPRQLGEEVGFEHVPGEHHVVGVAVPLGDGGVEVVLAQWPPMCAAERSARTSFASEQSVARAVEFGRSARRSRRPRRRSRGRS